MKLSTRVRYGLRGVFDIAFHGGGEPVHLKEIAARQQVTPRYLEQIFHVLKKEGLLEATRGPKGGYRLARPASAICVGDLVRAADGPICFEGALETAAEQAAADLGAEFLQGVWGQLGAEVSEVFDALTLETLCERAERSGLKRASQADPIMYFI